MAKLVDIGNLVLVQQDNQRVTRQSFDYPTNTMLPLYQTWAELADWVEPVLNILEVQR